MTVVDFNLEMFVGCYSEEIGNRRIAYTVFLSRGRMKCSKRVKMF